MTTPRPNWQTALEKNSPDTSKAINALRQSVMAEGALSIKTKTLMTMLCDALLGHGDGVANIAQRARTLGASEAEIAETVGVAFYMGGMPGLVTGANAFREQPK
jgi:alkylhydroperoxidase/carboxymuconolactone decarboxylase family protein YurZ